MSESLGKLKSFNQIYPESQEMFRRLVEAVRVGIYMADVDGKLTYVNHAFVDILGYDIKDEVLGLNLAKELYLVPQECEHVLLHMAKTGFVRDYIVRCRRKDGCVVILSITSNYIRDQYEEIIGVEGVVHDITRQKKLEESHDILAKAVEQADDNIMITDRMGVIKYVNPAFERSTGYTQAEITGKTPKILKSGIHDRDYYQKLWTTVLSGNVFHSLTMNKNKNGNYFTSEQTISPIKNDFGEIINFVSVWRDVTEKVTLENRIKEERNKLEEIIGFGEKVSTIHKFDLLMDFVVEKVTGILNAGKCSLMLLDENKDELCVKGIKGGDENLINDIRLRVDSSIAGIVAIRKEPVLVQDIENDGRFNQMNREKYLGRSFIIAPIVLDSKLIGVINVGDKRGLLDQEARFDEMDLRVLSAVCREIAVAIENIRLYKELNFLSVVDPLTNIHNYRYFTRMLDYEIKRSDRFERPLCLMMADIDDFSSYNEEFGYLDGDRLLKEVGSFLEDMLRDIDVVCRYAGDQFVIILPETGPKEAELVAQKIKKGMGYLRSKKTLTLSIGITCYLKGMTRYGLTAKTDQALYKAKRDGKNCICIFV